MRSRNWILFLVALGCAWAIGLFMGSSGGGSSQNVIAASGGNADGPVAAHQTSMALKTSVADGEPKSVYSFTERLRGISSHPSAKWRNAQFARLAEEIPIGDMPAFIRAFRPCTWIISLSRPRSH